MPQLVKLTHGDGTPVWVNPAHVAVVAAAALLPGGTVLHLAVAHTEPDDSSSLHRLMVTDSPARVVAGLERALLVVPV